MDDELVYCGKCGETKPRSAFYSLQHSTAPRRPCKACLLADKRARYATQDGDRISHAQVLREKYNLTPRQYEAMLKAQQGLCAICRKPETARGRGGAPRRLAVDHDHRTGEIRKLLCQRCNLVTWAVEENPDLLDAIRYYLLSYQRGFPPR
ncbi:endonuclease domain-containing protein [Actinoplanes solisilvae]|uniref:endonuclease domain-containing protein n=1 Tax=Actinoplanes solisilvae TaxID=2486853 RepID=UPI000FD9A8B6|nr:endonuclease domain-containing protein [Actinoplanes solisilvae]